MDHIMVDGQLVAYEAAAVSPGDAGFLHGAGLFETMRVHNGAIFRAADHLARLSDSAQMLGITLALSLAQLREMTADLLEAEDVTEARLRLTITRGDVYAAADHPETTPPISLVLAAQKFQPYPKEFYETGVSVVASRFKQNPENPLTGHKTTSYLDRLIALRDAQKTGAVEALWFTARENALAEGSVSNVFIVDRDGIIATPPLTMPEHGEQRLCLPGIARRTVLDLARDANLLPHERILTIDDMLAAREVFLTNAMMMVMPVVRVEKHGIGDERPGEITRMLMERYAQRLEQDCPPAR
jgi:branched-subunit amino acid aminotransferase/4-amino-4-deoxychorismate lyase